MSVEDPQMSSAAPDSEVASGEELRIPSSALATELLEELKRKIRQLLHTYVCVSLSSLPTLYDQQYKSKLSPEDYGISGEFSLTRLLRKMPDVVAVAPAMDPFKGAIIIPLQPEAVVVHPPLPLDLRHLVDMSGTELGSNCGEDEDPYWVKYQEDRATEMLTAIVHQLRNEFVQLARGYRQGLPIQQFRERYEKFFQKKMNMLLGCKLASFVQTVCNMASDELCLREGKVFAYEVGVGTQAVERDRLKADFVKMLRQHPNGLPIALFKDAYEEFFHRPLVLVNCLGNEGRTLIKVLGEMSDVVYLETNVAFLKIAVTTDVSGVGLAEKDRRTIADKVNRNHRMLRELRRQLFELLTASPDGIRLTDIPPRYEMLFGRKLDPRAYGCLKLLNVLQAVSDMVFIEQKDEGHWIASLTEQAALVIAQADKDEEVEKEAMRQSRRRENKGGGHFSGGRGAGKGLQDGDYSKGGGRGFKGAGKPVAPFHSEHHIVDVPRASHHMKGSGRGIGKQSFPPGLGFEVDARTSGRLPFDHAHAGRSHMSPRSGGFAGMELTMGRTFGQEAAKRAEEPSPFAIKTVRSPTTALATVMAEGVGWKSGSEPSDSPYFRGDLKPFRGTPDKWNDGIRGAAPLAQPQQQAMFSTWDFSNHFHCQVGDGPPRKKTCFDSLETTDMTKPEPWMAPTHSCLTDPAEALGINDWRQSVWSPSCKVGWFPKTRSNGQQAELEFPKELAAPNRISTTFSQFKCELQGLLHNFGRPHGIRADQLPNAYFHILGKQLIDTIASCVGHTDYMAVVTAMPDVLRVMPSVHGLMLFPVT